MRIEQRTMWSEILRNKTRVLNIEDCLHFLIVVVVVRKGKWREGVWGREKWKKKVRNEN